MQTVENNNSSFTYDNSKSVAENILHNNVWFVEKFGSVQFGPKNEIDWSSDPFKNRSWLWLFHQLSFIKDLLAYDKQNSSSIGLNFSVDVIKSWWKCNKDIPFTSNVIWHDHASALRLRRILDVFNCLFTGKHFIDGDEDFFYGLIKKHADYLANEKYYSRGNNHGLDQTISLFLACVSLKDQDWSVEYIKLCRERFIYEVGRMFDADGGHLENSCHYQGLGINQLIMVKNLLNKYRDILSPDEFLIEDFIEKATKVLCFMLTPWGQYSPVGDTEAVSQIDIFPNYSRPKNYTNFKFALSAGSEGDPLKEKILVLPESGWAFYRNRWQDKNDFYFLAKCGYKSDYHRQDDDTSFILCFKGEEWFTDGGLFNYHEADSHRQFIRSHHAHSMSVPLDEQPIRKITLFKGDSSLVSNFGSDNSFHLKMKTDIFSGYRIFRNISIEKNLSFSICDFIEKRKNFALTKYRTRFIVPEDKEIIVCDDFIEIKKENMALRISILSGVTPQVEVNPIFISRNFNKLIRAKALDIRFESLDLNVIYRCSWL